MSYEIYKIIHLVGVLLLVCSLGAMAMHAWLGRSRGDGELERARKGLVMFHGIAATVILVAGFGLMARLGLMSTWPTWIVVKLAIWLVLGVATVFIKRAPGLGRTWVLLIPLVAGIAVAVAIYKPG